MNQFIRNVKHITPGYLHSDSYIHSPFLDPITKIKLFDQLVAENSQLKLILEVLLKQRLPIPKETPSSFTNGKFCSSLIHENQQLALKHKESPNPLKIEDIAMSPTSRVHPLPNGLSCYIKQEDPSFSSPKASSMREEDAIEEIETKKPQILKRHGFKAERTKCKHTPITKREKKVKVVRQRSKAKHLWITYGRKIAEYALKHTEGETHKKIKVLGEFLASKAGYFEAFGARKSDLKEDIEIKRTFGELALRFVEEEADDAFLSSNYRSEMLGLRDKVTEWIRRQISQ